MTVREYDDKPRACPGCGKMLDGAALDADVDSSDDRGPEPGDVSICIYCRTLTVFTEDGLRHPTDEELAEALQNPVIARAIAVVGEWHERRSSK